MPVVEVAVLVDTNVFANGTYSSARLRKLVTRVERKGHRLMVPLIVVWEWAEHAHAAHELFRSQAIAAIERVDPLLRGGIAVPPPSHVEDVVSATIEAVEEAGGEVVDPPEEAGLDAVRQQVLQTGHGTKKEKVKTGAADALLAATVACVAEEAQSTVVVTADRRLGRILGDVPRVRVVEGQRELWEQLLVVAPAEGQIVRRFETYVIESVRQALAEGTQPLPTSSPQYDHGVAEALGLHRDAELLDLTVLRVSEIRAVEPEVVGDEAGRFLSSELVLVGWVGGYSWHFGGPDFELVHEYSEAEVQVRLMATGDLDEEFNPVSYEFDGPVRLEATEEHLQGGQGEDLR